jgi:thioredoxin 1
MKKILLFLFLAFGTLFAFEELTVDNFDQKIKGKNVVVDFHSPY